MRWVLLACLVLPALLIPTPTWAEASSSDVDELLRHAETFYWLGMAEGGNLQAFQRGLTFIARARERLESATLPADMHRRHVRKIDALLSDLREQEDISHDTLYGVFPLVRVWQASVLGDSTITGTFEMVDDPDVIAATTAAESLAQRVADDAKTTPQMDVVFLSAPPSRALENELLYVFNASSKYYVHNRREMVAILPELGRAEPAKGLLTPDQAQRVLAATGARKLLSVTVREMDVVDEVHFFQIEGELYTPGVADPVCVPKVMGFCRDRRPQGLWVLAANLLLLLVAIGLCAALQRRPRLSPGMTLILAVVAFAVARFLAWGIVSILRTVVPPAETLVLLSWWWPMATGVALLLAPLVVLYVGALRLAKLAPQFALGRQITGIFAAAALGSSAYMAGPLLLASVDQGVALLAGLATCWVAIAVAVGLASGPQSRFPKLALALGLLLLCSLSLAAAHLSTATVWAGVPVSLACVGLGAPWRRVAREAIVEAPAEREFEPDLAALAQSPEHQRFELFEKGRELLASLLEGKGAQLGLCGPAGVGKTATASALLQDLVARSGGDTFVTLRAQCSQEGAEGTPYAVFRECLADQLGVDLLGERTSQLEKLGGAMEGLLTSVMPLGDVLFPPIDAEGSIASSEEEVAQSVIDAITRLLRSHRVVLFVDDAHWMDDGSTRMMARLTERFPAGAPEGFGVVLTSRSQETIEAAGIGAGGLLHAGRPTREQKLKILTGSLRLSEHAARRVIGDLPDSVDDRGALHCLMAGVAHLGRREVLVWTGGCFELAEEYRKGKSLPIPEEMYEALCAQLDEHPEWRELLECAACVGRVFQAEVLARCLSLERLEMLRRLRQVEEQTGLLRDVCPTDDAYEFGSTFVLEVIRQRAGILDRGPACRDVPQVVREYHARIARALEERGATSGQQVVALARHYYAAGRAQAKQGVAWCTRAAGALRGSFAFDEALEFVSKAEECAQAAGLEFDAEQQRLLIRCDCAHVHNESEDQIATAQEALAYLDEHPDVPFELRERAVRTVYEAARSRSAYIPELARSARAMLDCSRCALERAEALQYLGLHHVLAERGLGREDAAARQEQQEQARANLREALESLEAAPEQDLEIRKCRARIMNSLAESLMSDRSPETRAEAERLFRESLEIRQDPAVGDLPGLARAHGGLGRYYLRLDPPDVDRAEQHFSADLDISVKLGDVAGQGMMHSFLGACALQKDDHQRAGDHYRNSWELSDNITGKMFAASGLMRALARGNRSDQLEKVADEVVRELEGQSIQGDWVGALEQALTEANDAMPSAKVSELLDRIRPASP
jgi:DNA polymerase III delta prime subunit